jgi:hypothetical protein
MVPNDSTSITTSCVFPLLDGWTLSEAVDDAVTADGIALRRAGVASRKTDGTELTGSAASLDGAPIERARYELLERMATVDAISGMTVDWKVWSSERTPRGVVSSAEAFPESACPERWRFARSSGVALHCDWDSACKAAREELAERDRVLRSWYGETVPAPVEAPAQLVVASSYEWSAFLLPAPERSWSEDVVVAGVIGFPRCDVPLVLGYGAGTAADVALRKAVGEALQSLAFLWGEPAPQAEPELSPSALGHLEWWLYPGHHDQLKRWLDGQHARYATNERTQTVTQRETTYLDLTPKGLDRHRVVKAMSPAALPLAFGACPFGEHLPSSLRVHPIV